MNNANSELCFSAVKKLLFIGEFFKRFGSLPVDNELMVESYSALASDLQIIAYELNQTVANAEQQTKNGY